jgi:UDP-galactose transporter
MFSPKQAPYTLVAALTMALQPIFLTLSKGSAGYFEYSVGSATFLTEGIKLILSLVLLVIQLVRNPELRGNVLSKRPVIEFLQFLVPSVIYFANNNLVYVILQALDPSTFQLLSQTKTIFTGLLFRWLLRKRLTVFQWMALFFLACGTACSQIPTNAESSDQPKTESASHAIRLLRLSPDAEDKHPLPAIVGVLVSLATALLSSLAGVYNEMLLKRRVTAPINWQNAQMYIHGLWLNATFMLIYDWDEIRSDGLLYGYNGWTWAAIVCNASVGLAVAAVLKFCDNIARVYAHSISMIVVMVASVPLFGLQLTAQLIIALLLVVGSTVQYNVPEAFAERFDRIEPKGTKPADESTPKTDKSP